MRGYRPLIEEEVARLPAGLGSQSLDLRVTSAFLGMR